MMGISMRRLILAGAGLGFMIAGLPAMAQCSGTSYPVAVPHIAYNGGWETTILIRNTGTSAATVTACYFSNTGTALSAPANGTNATSSTVNVPANGQAEIDFADSSPGSATTAGWAGFAGGLPAGVSAQAVFVSSFSAAAPTGVCIIPIPDLTSYTVTSQAVAPPVNNSSGATLSMPFDDTNGQISGYALANTSNQPVTVTLTFYNESGSQIATYTPPQLAAFGHTEFLLNASGLPGALANAKGIMTISSTSVYPLGFRFALSSGAVESFTTWLP